MMEDLVSSGGQDPVTRLRRFRAEHPEIDVKSPLDNRSAWWKAYRNGECLAVEHELFLLMNDLDSLADAGTL